jgi:hypothetical protein
LLVQDQGLFTAVSARTYGQFLGRRYKDCWNVVWVLGGDRVPLGYEGIWNALAAGIRGGDGGRHLMTYHVSGTRSSSEYWHTATWLDFNMLQSGHPLGVFSNNYDFIRIDYERTPPNQANGIFRMPTWSPTSISSCLRPARIGRSTVHS